MEQSYSTFNITDKSTETSTHIWQSDNEIHMINMNNRITQLESHLKTAKFIINNKQIKIQELNKKIRIQCDDDDIIKKLDEKLFIIRGELRKVREENEKLLENIRQLESEKEKNQSKKID